jgi:hypothetical protein
MKRWMSVPTFGVLLLLLSFGLASAQAIDCPELVERALKAVTQVCSTLGRNEACYGNDRLQAELQNNDAFTKPADKVPVGDIRTIRTFGLDEKAGTWGIVVMNVLANLPDTLPGQGVKFILYGDVAIKNASGSGTPQVGPMQAFYFTTNPFKPGCKQAPADSLVIQSPKGYRVKLSANGMDLDVGSSIVLSAQRGKRMTMTTLQGKVYATYKGKKQVIPQGFEASVALSGDDGLTPADVPDTAYLLDDNEWEALNTATDGLTETDITVPDTDKWKSIDEYCADPANAGECDDPGLSSELSFSDCPDDVCSPLADEPVGADSVDTTCVDLFCDPLPQLESAEEVSVDCGSSTCPEIESTTASIIDQSVGSKNEESFDTPFSPTSIVPIIESTSECSENCGD